MEVKFSAIKDKASVQTIADNLYKTKYIPGTRDRSVGGWCRSAMLATW
ncbi:MAG: hypothetical protein K6G31_13995 [Paludibacteraceae bacterium]|nr:hypothetical protein [Paludibacteraceae bacterium]